MTFAEVMKRLMDEQGLNQSDVAARIGKPRQYISKLITGYIKDPTFDVACRIADALGVTIGEFAEMMKEGKR